MYGTIAAHTRHRASVLIVFVVFCVYMYNFAGLIRWTQPPMFSDTAITDCHSDTTIFQLGAHWVRISWSIGSEKLFRRAPRRESNPRLPACKASTLSTRPGSPLGGKKSCGPPLIFVKNSACSKIETSRPALNPLNYQGSSTRRKSLG